MRTTREREKWASGSATWNPQHGAQALGAPLRRKNGTKPAEPTAGWVALDPVIHERTRLAILTALSTSTETALSFLDLRDTLRLTDGNLLAHLRTL